MAKPFQLPNGKWKVIIDNKKLFGSKRPSHTSERKADVVRWERETIASALDGRFPRSGDRVTRLFNEALDLVLDDGEMRLQKGRLAPGSLVNIEQGVKLARAIGHLPIHDMDTKPCQDLINDIEATRKHANIVRVALRRAFELAKQEGWIGRNPLVDVPLLLRSPETDKRDWRGIDEEIEEVLQAQLTHDGEEHYQTQELRYDVLTVLAGTGMRPQELVAMQWENLAQVEGLKYYEIKWAWCGTSHRLKDPKRKASARVILLVPDVLEVLERRWERQGRPTAGFMFLNEEGRPIYQNLHNLFWRAMKKAGKIGDDGKTKFRLYDFRHSNISSLFREQVPMHEIAEHAGHSRFSFTADRYGHVTWKTRKVDHALMAMNARSRERRGLLPTPEQTKLLSPPPALPAPPELVLKAEEIFGPGVDELRRKTRSRERTRRYRERQALGPLKPETPEQVEKRRTQNREKMRRWRERRKQAVPAPQENATETQ